MFVVSRLLCGAWCALLVVCCLLLRVVMCCCVFRGEGCLALFVVRCLLLVGRRLSFWCLLVLVCARIDSSLFVLFAICRVLLVLVCHVLCDVCCLLCVVCGLFCFAVRCVFAAVRCTSLVVCGSLFDADCCRVLFV